MASTALWSKGLVLSTASKTFSSIVFSCLTATISTYQFLVYRVDVGTAGFGVGIFIIAAMLSRIVAGRYLEIAGRKRMLVAGSIAFFLATLMYFVPVGFALFIAIRFIHGLAFGVVSNTIAVVNMSFIPDERWGEGLGFASLSASLSNAAGPFFGVILSQVIGFTAVFAMVSACALVALVLTIPIDADPSVFSGEASKDARCGTRLTDFIEPKALPFSLLLLAVNVCFASVTSFLTTYVGRLGLAVFAPWYFLVYSVVLVLSRPGMGKLLDARGCNAVFYPSLVALLLGFVVLGALSTATMLFLVAFLIGVGYGGMTSSTQAIAVKAAPPQRISIATSTFYVCADTGLGIGPLVMGGIVPFAGYSGMYLVGAVVILATVGAYTFVQRKYLGFWRQRNAGRTVEEAPSVSASPCVVTIAREHGAGGSKIGMSLARRLGARFYGREEALEVAREMDVEDDFGKQMEDRADSELAYRMFLGSAESVNARKAQETVLREIASRGPCVVVGRAADNALSDVGARVSVFLYASDVHKTEAIMRRRGLSRNQAREDIARADRARRAYYRFMTGKEWGDARNYDLAFDAGIGIEQSAQLIEAYVSAVLERGEGQGGAAAARDEGDREGRESREGRA